MPGLACRTLPNRVCRAEPCQTERDLALPFRALPDHAGPYLPHLTAPHPTEPCHAEPGRAQPDQAEPDHAGPYLPHLTTPRRAVPCRAGPNRTCRT